MEPNLYAVSPRPEREFEGKWGVRLLTSGEWVPVTFRSEQDANEAIAAVVEDD